MVTPLVRSLGLGEDTVFAIRKLPPQQAIIFTELYLAGEKGLSGAELTERLYNNTPECGPLYAREVTRIVKHRLQRKLPALGFSINTSRGRKGRYKLQRFTDDR